MNFCALEGFREQMTAECHLALRKLFCLLLAKRINDCLPRPCCSGAAQLSREVWSVILREFRSEALFGFITSTIKPLNWDLSPDLNSRHRLIMQREISELSGLATGVRTSCTGGEKIGNVLWEMAILKFQHLISVEENARFEKEQCVSLPVQWLVELGEGLPIIGMRVQGSWSGVAIMKAIAIY